MNHTSAIISIYNYILRVKIIPLITFFLLLLLLKDKNSYTTGRNKA